MWKQLTKRSNVPLLKQESNKILDGFSISDCTSFSIYLKNVNTIIQDTTREQDELRPKSGKIIQQVYEIHRQVIQYVFDVLQHFMDEFNRKFDKFYASGEQDVQLHLLEFNGSDTFTLVMRTENKPLMKEGIIFWKMMITQLQEALKQQNICILSSVYFGEVCVNFYESKENIIDFYLFGSAINGSIRGCKLSKALDLQLNLLLHKDFAINFMQKTSLLSYMLKKKDTSYVKTTDATIQSSFFIIPYSTIKDLTGVKYTINPFCIVINEIKQHNHKVPSQSNIKNLEQTLDVEQMLKVLNENKEGFEGATIIKLVFSITNQQSKINQQQAGLNESKLGLSSEQQQSGKKKQNRVSCLEGVDWEEERMNVKIKLQEIMNQIQELVATLNIQYSNIFHCSFQNLLTIRLIIRNKIDHSSRAALFISVMKQFQLTNLKKVKASSQLFFFYVLFIKGYETYKRQIGQDQIQRGYEQRNTIYDIIQQGQQNIYDTVSLFYLRDRKVNYQQKSDGIFKYNQDIVNFYFRENPSNMLSFKSHWNPILNHCLSYQNASIFEEKRNIITKKLQDCINSSTIKQQTFSNEIILIEGDIGSGKSSFMQLLSIDIANTFKPGQCVVFTKSLRGFIMFEIKLRLQPSNNINNQRKKERRLFLNAFNDIILRQSIHHCNQLQEQYLQTADPKQQNILAKHIFLILTLQTFLNEDPLKMQPKSLLIQNIEKMKSQNKEDLQIDDKMRIELVQLGYKLLMEYLHSLKIKFIIFMIDDIQYQDQWSWQIMKKISQNSQKDFKIIILSTFRFHLPSEINEDISTYTCIEPKIIPMINTSTQLFANNCFLNERISEITTSTSIRINLNSITVLDQRKILIEAIQSFYTCKVEQEQSKEAVNFILVQLFRRNKCNNPQKILTLLHVLCKSSFVLIYEVEKEAGAVGKRLSQLSVVDDNEQSKDSLDQFKAIQTQKQNENLKKVFIGINETFQNMDSTIFDNLIDPPLYFSNINNNVMSNLLQENEVVTNLLPKQKYFNLQNYQANPNNQVDNFTYNNPENYLKDCQPVQLKNRSNLIWQSLSLLGDKFNINKTKFYLKNAFHLSEEQVLEIITDMYIYRLIVTVNNGGEKDYNNQIQLNQNKPKKSLNLSQQSNNPLLISQRSEEQDSQQNSSQTSKGGQQNQFNLIDFQFNENMFFLFKQSIQQQISLRVKLLFHKSYFDIMTELLQVLVQKNATNTQDFAEIYMELIHHNNKYSCEKIDQLLKKISPQITYFFRKNIYYHGEAYKFSSKHQGLVKCQLKLNQSTLLIFKDEEQSQSQLPSQKNLENQNSNQISQREKTQSHFFSQINQIREDLMTSTNRFQNIQSIWNIMKYDYTYQLFPDKQMIKIHVQYLTKHKENSDRFAQNKAIALTFPNPSSYFTFYMGLRYLQIEPYNPEFCYEKKENYHNITYLIQFPLLKSLPIQLDPFQKSDQFQTLKYSKISLAAQNIYFLSINNDYLKKLPNISQLKRNILELIPKGIFALQKQSLSPKKRTSYVIHSPTKSLNTSYQIISSQANIQDKNQSYQKRSFDNQILNLSQNSDSKVVQHSKNNSMVLEKVDKTLNSSNQYIEPLEASRVSLNKSQNNNQKTQIQKQDILVYEGNIVENQNLQEKLFEMKILNENQPETGKFNNIEGINQDNFTNSANKILNQNPNEDTETFRKKSEQFIGNVIDFSTFRNQSNSLANNKGLQVIQEEEQKHQNVSKKSQFTPNIQNKSDININRQESNNDIFDQIESERAQYNDQIYQEQFEESIKINQNMNNKSEKLKTSPNYYQKTLINSSNQFSSPTLPGSLYMQNIQTQEIIQSQKLDTIQDIKFQQNNEQRSQNSVKLSTNNLRPNIERINDSASMIMSETNRPLIQSNQYQNLQKQAYFNQQTPALYQLPVISENGLLNSQKYDQVQKNNQLPLEMSIQSNNILDIEDEENPFQTMNGLKVLQLQLTPITSATKSRSTSPFLRDTQSHSSMAPISQYSTQKSNLATPTKQQIQQQESNTKSQLNTYPDQRQLNLSGQNLKNFEQQNKQRSIQTNFIPEGKQINQINEMNNTNQSEIKPKNSAQNYNNDFPNQKQIEQQIIIDKQKQKTSESKINMTQKQPPPSSNSNQQTLGQIKFQQDLQKRLETVRINQEEFQKESQIIEQENSKNIHAHSINKELLNKQSQLPTYQERYTKQGNDYQSQSNRSDLYYVEDEKSEKQIRRQNEENNSQLNYNHINIDRMNNQVIKASKNHLANSKNMSRILSSEVMQSINDQPILYEQYEQNQGLNNRNNQKLNQIPLNNPQQVDKNNGIYQFHQKSQQNIQNQKQIIQNQQISQNFSEQKQSMQQPNNIFEQKHRQGNQELYIQQDIYQDTQLSLNNEKGNLQHQYLKHSLPKNQSNISITSSAQSTQRNVINQIQDKNTQQSNIFNKEIIKELNNQQQNIQQLRQQDYQQNNSIRQNGNKQSINPREEQIMQSQSIDINQNINIKKQNKSLNPFRDTTPNKQINQNISYQQNSSNQQIQQSQQQQNSQVQYPQQQQQTSASKVAQKQNEIIQKKKDSLKKYLSQNQNSVEGINILQNEERNSRMNSQTTIENEFTDEENKNFTQQVYPQNGRQFVSHQFSSINSSQVINDEDSYIGIVVKACNSFQGDKFQLKLDDCVIFKFLDEYSCEVHFEGKIGCIPKQNIKVIQKAQQFLVNLNNYNQRKQNDLNDTTLNNVHKILTDIDK